MRDTGTNIELEASLILELKVNLKHACYWSLNWTWSKCNIWA